MRGVDWGITGRHRSVTIILSLAKSICMYRIDLKCLRTQVKFQRLDDHIARVAGSNRSAIQ